MRAAACLALLAGCSRSPAPIAIQPSPPRPHPAASAPTAALPSVRTLATSAPAPPPSSPVPEPPPASLAPAPLVMIEALYSELGHDRLATEMLTLERDEQLFQWALGGSSNPAHASNQPGYHPATRVVVDVKLQSRAPKGTTKRLLRIARSSGYWPLRACFEAAERLAPRRERSAVVRLTLGASGKVLGSRSLRSSAEKEYTRCVLEKVRAIDFRPGFSRKLDVDIAVKQWPGDAPVPPRAPDATSPRLALPAETQTALEGLRPALSACYADALKVDERLWGRLVLRLESDTTGVVTQATPVESRFPSAEVVACVRQAVLGARLATPSSLRFSFAVRFGQPPAPPPPTAVGEPPSPSEPEPPAPLPPAPLPPMPSH